jgi:arylsulfatase A-like enzyme
MKTIGRRSFVKASSISVATGLWAAKAPAVDERKPNVLLFLSDDLRPDGIAALGNPVAKTPNLDAIVNRGVRFHMAHTMGSMIGAVCTPSRTMLLTGKSLFRATNTPSGDDPASHTFPRVMQNAGYATIHAGKWGNSPKKILNEFQETYDPGNAEQVADKVVDFIQRKAPTSPLFIYMAGKEPHDPQYAPNSFYAQYKPEDIPLPAAFAPYHPFNNGWMTGRDEMTLPFPRTPENIRGKLARYHASIAYMDEQFARVVQALKDAGQYDNTIFVIAGDNGLSLGEHGLLGKQNLYEFGGMHVPLVFAGPGITPGDNRALAYLMDIFPTICELTGVSNPAKVEGQSLAQIVQGKSAGVRDWLYTAYEHGQRAITDGRWKLIRYPLVDKTQLFDLESDPHEMNDLSVNAEHVKRIREMMDRLAELQRALSDPDPLHVEKPQQETWSPEMLTPEEIKFQISETAKCLGLSPK